MLGFTIATHQPNTVYNSVVFGRSRTICNGTGHNRGSAHHAGDTGDYNSQVEQEQYVDQYQQAKQ
eukprot:3479706-Amphidinium_carterae.1